MLKRPLGSSGLEASVVGFGAWAAGGWMWGGADADDAVRAMHAAIDAGVNLIDTAPVYGFGRSEEIVGQAIAGRRDRVIVATKCGLIWDRAEGEFHFENEKKVYKHTAPESIRNEVEASLRRLGVDTIDVLQTHWQTPTTPIEDTMATLLDLKREGKIRAIGVSNASIEQIERYRALGPVDVDQESVSMLDRRMMRSGQLEHCRLHDIAVFAYSPMARGLLTGKIGPDHTFKPGDHRAAQPLFSVDNRRRVQTMLDAIRPIADAHGATLGQLAIAWAIVQPGMTHALVGARNAKQATENAAAASVALSTEDLARIDAAIDAYERASA
jgi:methylglyoxal reductase